MTVPEELNAYETPMKDHIERFIQQLRDGWRVRTNAPDALASASYGDGFSSALLAAISPPIDAEPVRWLYTEHYADRPAQTVTLDYEPKPLPYPGRSTITPLYTRPAPAPGPAGYWSGYKAGFDHASPPGPADAVSEATHHHVKSGHDVREIGRGRMQISSRFPLADMDDVVIYEHDGNLWVRAVVEFEDGRFVPLEAAQRARK